jgi:hypothetical protein
VTTSETEETRTDRSHSLVGIGSAIIATIVIPTGLILLNAKEKVGEYSKSHKKRRESIPMDHAIQSDGTSSSTRPPVKRSSDVEMGTY